MGMNKFVSLNRLPINAGLQLSIHILYLYITMDRALGSGTSGFPVHGVQKTRPEKSAFLAGSGAPSGFRKRGKKIRKTHQGHPAVMEEEKRQKRSVTERHHIARSGLSYGRGCENQEARVFDLHEKKLGKGVVKRAEIA